MQVGPYPLLGELGRGASGVVYRARDASLRRDVALKLLTSLSNPVRRERFAREAQALAKLRHPNIVAIHHVGEHQGHAYMVLDLVEGESLQARLKRDGPLPPLEAARLAATLARALHHVHVRGVAHRDVKPANVLLSAGTPLLTDFGLAKDLDAARPHLSREGYGMGTPGYWSPEQALGQVERMGPASDVYSLGATLYAALTGAPPLRCGGSLPEAVAATCDEVPPLASSRRPVPAALDAICARCLAKDPAARFPSAEALAAALDAVVAAGAAVEVGRTIGRYELLAELARGGMGVVHRGRDPAIGREVAVKLFRLGERSPPGALERFQREARAAGKLRHPGVVPVYDFGVVGTTAYLVMDLVEGETLADRLRRGGPLPPREAARLCEAVARTLAFAHTQGIVHRDVKPSNILLRDGQPLLFDFGIARCEGDASMSTTGQLLGTPSYMAPEQLAGERGKVGPAADVYAVGGTLYELLTGEVPFDADNLLTLVMAKTGAAPEAPAALRAEIGADLSAICLRCLQTDPQARYASAELLAQDLAAYLAGAEVQANPLRPAERAWRGLRRRPVAVAGAALVAGVALTLPLAAILGRGAAPAVAGAEPPPAAPTAPVVTAPPPDAATHVAEVQRWLDRAGSGELAARPDGLQEAVWAVAQRRQPEVVALLTSAVSVAAGTLLDAQDAWLRANAAGERGLEESLRCRRETAIGADMVDAGVYLLDNVIKRATKGGGKPALATAMRQRVGQPLLDRARLACEALGRLEASEDALVALAAYIRAEPDPLRALPAGQALARLPGPRARQLALWSLKVQGYGSAYTRQMRAVLEGGVEGGPAPADALGFAKRGRERYLQGDSPGTVEDMTEALRLDPTCAEAWAYLGAVHLDRGDCASALREFERAVQLQPTDSVYCMNRGLARMRLRDLKGAVVDFDRAIELDARNELAWINRGCARRHLGELGRALDDLTHALELAPRSAEAWTFRAETHVDRRDPARAIDDYTNALEIAPGRAATLVSRGDVYHRRGDPGDLDLAVADYTRAIGLDPSASSARRQRASARYRQRDFQGALEDATVLLELTPNDAEGWRLRGRCRHRCGDPKGAIEDFTRALALVPDDLLTLDDRGRSREAIEDLAGARADYARVLERNPRHPEAARYRALVDAGK